jgi:hypothetical protein
MARGMGYSSKHGSMGRSPGKHAAITATKRVKALTAKRKREGNVLAKSKKY